MEMLFAQDSDGMRSYYVKAHMPFEDFMAELRLAVDEGDPILNEQPEHCWMRACRDFQEKHGILIEAAPRSRGAFPVTWVQEA